MTARAEAEDTVVDAVQDDPRPMTREQRRSKRARVVRAKTISIKRMTKRELELGRMLYPEGESERPRTRSECQGGARPCPYVSCHHHLYLDVNPKTGAIKLNFPDLEPDQLAESCALDVADRGETTLEQTGKIMNLTRERIRQLEVAAIAAIRGVDSRTGDRLSQAAEVDGTERAVRRLPVLQDQDRTDPSDLLDTGDFDDAGELENVPNDFVFDGPDTDFDASDFAAE